MFICPADLMFQIGLKFDTESEDETSLVVKITYECID